MAIVFASLAMDGFAQSVAPGAKTHIDADSGDWRPSAAQTAAAEAAATKFMTALSQGRYADAYALFTPATKKRTEEKPFESDRGQWTKRQGAAKSLVFTDLSWSKNPKAASAPGVYVAIGFLGHYAQMERYCGYIVLSQSPAGGSFLVNHVEESALDNKTADAILKDKGQSFLDQSWKTLSERCPDVDVAATAPANITEVNGALANLSFDSVADARAKLKGREGVSFAKGTDGWESYADESSHTVWSFAPADYDAYPAMIERRLVGDSKGASIKMSVLCEADKAACDRMVKEADAQNRATAARLGAGNVKPASSQ